MKKFNLNALAAGVLIALSVGVAGCSSPTSAQSAQEVAKENIAVRFESDEASCKAMSGNAKDICHLEAKGRKSIALAELEATHDPSDANRDKVREAKADAAHAIAMERCEDYAGNAKDVCQKEADRAQVNTDADATLRSTTAEANATASQAIDAARLSASETATAAQAAARETTREATEEATTDKRAADYAVALQKCDRFAGTAKDECISAAKALHGQT